MMLTETLTPEPMDPEMIAADYIRRIHWWVRLFGIIWIVIPAVAAVAAAGFLLTTMVAGS